MLDKVCEMATQVQSERRRKGPGSVKRKFLVEGLKQMVPALDRIATEGERLGLDADVLNHLRPGIEARAKELAALN